MFEKIFIESEIIQNQRTQHILDKLKVNINHQSIYPISKIEDYFGKVKKPYLQKRDNLNLFIGKKKGQLLKTTPAAYGTTSGRHYYFIHAYNCIYECSYCYLQGHFHSPDLVIFINHEEILREMKNICQQYADETIWFHAGEFSDSLVLSHITGELPLYHQFVLENQNAVIELRTKSANIKELLKLTPHPRFIASFSLAPAQQISDYDLKTPPLKTRLLAISSLNKSRHPIGLHFDPIIYSCDVFDDYHCLLKELKQHIELADIEYLSLGVVRFTKDVFSQVQKNYPQAKFFSHELEKDPDGKIRYSKTLRFYLLKKISQLCQESGIPKDKIYLCMEETERRDSIALNSGNQKSL